MSELPGIFTKTLTATHHSDQSPTMFNQSYPNPLPVLNLQTYQDSHTNSENEADGQEADPEQLDMPSPSRRKTFPALRSKFRLFHSITRLVLTKGHYSKSTQDSPALSPREDTDSPGSGRKSDSGKKRGKYRIYN